MRHYELMVILDADLEERTVAPSLDRFLNVVRQGGGSVDKVDIWGRRRLAYEIDKKTEGIYAVVDLMATPAVAQELDRQLGLNESVLRTKLLRPVPKKPVPVRTPRPDPAEGATPEPSAAAAPGADDAPAAASPAAPGPAGSGPDAPSPAAPSAPAGPRPAAGVRPTPTSA